MARGCGSYRCDGAGFPSLRCRGWAGRARRGRGGRRPGPRAAQGTWVSLARRGLRSRSHSRPGPPRPGPHPRPVARQSSALWRGGDLGLCLGWPGSGRGEPHPPGVQVDVLDFTAQLQPGLGPEGLIGCWPTTPGSCVPRPEVRRPARRFPRTPAPLGHGGLPVAGVKGRTCPLTSPLQGCRTYELVPPPYFLPAGRHHSSRPTACPLASTAGMRTQDHDADSWRFHRLGTHSQATLWVDWARRLTLAVGLSVQLPAQPGSARRFNRAWMMARIRHGQSAAVRPDPANRRPLNIQGPVGSAAWSLADLSS